MGSAERAGGGGADPGYDPAATAKGLTAIDGAATEVNALLQTIQREVEVLGGSWRAHSNVAFTQVYAKWADPAALIINALQTMYEKLAATDVTCARTEQAQVDQCQALANSI